MSRRCRFCETALELTYGGGLQIDTWRCPVCHCRESFGLECLPDPDRLRDRADELEQLANEIESSALARRFEAVA